ncbi:hypothetical protein [Streptomyces sp. TR06-5]|uniref:hypothetical protein n=1 Tax=unclassified Streptomyces TaxID=2593676 RepID=UPI0039A285D6
MLSTTVCAALSAAGLAVALLTAFRRRFVAATRVAAFALLPIGLALAGLISLAADVGRAVARWAADLVLDPVVWTGFALLAVAVVLYVAARVAAGRRSAAVTGEGSPEGAGNAVAAGRDRREVARASKDGAGGRSGASTGGDDFSDVEAILKKHGI